MDVLLAAIDPVILLGNIVILPVFKSLIQTRRRSSRAMPFVPISVGVALYSRFSPSGLCLA